MVDLYGYSLVTISLVGFAVHLGGNRDWKAAWVKWTPSVGPPGPRS